MTGQNAVVRSRFARMAADAYVNGDEFPTEMDWVAACDETMSDLARSFGLEPKFTLQGVLERLAAR